MAKIKGFDISVEISFSSFEKIELGAKINANLFIGMDIDILIKSIIPYGDGHYEYVAITTGAPNSRL